MSGFVRASVVLVPFSSAQRLSRSLARTLPRAICVLLSSLRSVPPQPGVGAAGAKFLAITDEVVSILEPSADLRSSDCCHLPALHGSAMAPGHAAACLPSSTCQPQGSLGHKRMWVTTGSPGPAQTKKCPMCASAPSSSSPTFASPVTAFSSPSHSSLRVTRPVFL